MAREGVLRAEGLFGRLVALFPGPFGLGRGWCWKAEGARFRG